MADQFKNYIGGEWVEPSNGQYFENRNPAKQSDLIGLWPRSTREDVDRAVAAAKAAFPAWSRTPAGRPPRPQQRGARGRPIPLPPPGAGGGGVRQRQRL